MSRFLDAFDSIGNLDDWDTTDAEADLYNARREAELEARDE